jgi:hypothetical protein
MRYYALFLRSNCIQYRSLVEPGSRTRTSASGVAAFRGLKSLLAESLVESLDTLVVRMAFEAVRNLT